MCVIGSFPLLQPEQEETNPLHDEVKKMMSFLFPRLDALASWHYKPTQVIIHWCHQTDKYTGITGQVDEYTGVTRQINTLASQDR